MIPDSENPTARRKFPRVSREFPFSFRIVRPQKENEWHRSNTRFLGGGGISAILPVPLPVGTILHGKLALYASVIEFTAEVVWIDEVTRSDAGPSLFGLRFSQISQENLLAIQDMINRSREGRIEADLPSSSF